MFFLPLGVVAGMFRRMVKHGFFSGLAAVLLLGVGVHAAEPANLGPHKDELRAYVKSGEYDRDLAAAAAPARAWLEQRTAKRVAGERLAMVIDLDETLLSNWPQIVAERFGGNPASWDAWMSEGKAAAIEPVRELYRFARSLQVDVIFMTGRPEHFRVSTQKNLRAIDCADYAELICRPEGSLDTAAAYKTAQRKRLTEEGRVIVANIGDQESDLVGGYAERTFKLPNPFYFTP